jgi:hypothetical protein
MTAFRCGPPLHVIYSGLLLIYWFTSLKGRLNVPLIAVWGIAFSTVQLDKDCKLKFGSMKTKYVTLAIMLLLAAGFKGYSQNKSGDRKTTHRQTSYNGSCYRAKTPVHHVVHHKVVAKKKQVVRPVPLVAPAQVAVKPAPATICPVAVKPVVKRPAVIEYRREREYTGRKFPTRRQVMKERNKVHIGIEAGIDQNGMRATGAQPDQYVGRMLNYGFLGGLVMDARLGNHVALQPGLRYITKGGVAEIQPFSGSTQRVKDDLRFHYIELPLDLVYKTGNEQGGRLTIGAGPYIAYMAKWKDIHEIEGVTGNSKLPTESSIDPEMPSAAQRLDWGVGGFIGAELPAGVFAKAGIEAGLRDVQQNPVNGQYYNRNYNFLLSVGYFFAYKK